MKIFLCGQVKICSQGKHIKEWKGSPRLNGYSWYVTLYIMKLEGKSWKWILKLG